MKTILLLLLVSALAPLALAPLALAPLASAQESYGTIKATTKLRGDGSKATTIMDPEKHTAEETLVDANGKLVKRTTFLLGERDLAIGAIYYDAKGNITYRASFQRDALGHVIETSYGSPDGKYLGKRIFTYGPNDTVLTMQDYDARGQLIPSTSAPKTSTRRR